MFLGQGVPAPSTTWSRAAIHDTVAAIARQAAYRRDLGSSLLDRILRWIYEAYRRFAEALGSVPHARLLATIAASTVIALVIARLVYANRLRATVVDLPNGARRRLGSEADPWHEAEALAAAGRFTEAAHALYRGVLVMLASHKLVRLHESKTSGDYARELRRRGSPAYAAFRRFGQRYDRIIYGTGECNAQDYDGLLDDARQITPATERAA